MSSRGLAKRIMRRAQRFGNSPLYKAVLTDSSGITDDTLLSPTSRYILATFGLSRNFMDALWRAHAAMALQAYRPRVSYWETVGLDRESLWLYHESMLVTQVVSLLDIALRLSNHVLGLGLPERSLRFGDVVRKAKKGGYRTPRALLQGLRLLRDSVEPYREVRNPHLHGGDSVPHGIVQAFWLTAPPSVAEVLDRSGLNAATWKLAQEVRLRPVVKAARAVMRHLLPAYNRERRKLDAGQHRLAGTESSRDGDRQ